MLKVNFLIQVQQRVYSCSIKFSQTLKSPLKTLSLTLLERSSPFPTRASALPMQCAMSVPVPTCANAVCQCARLAVKVVAASLLRLSCASLLRLSQLIYTTSKY